MQEVRLDRGWSRACKSHPAHKHLKGSSDDRTSRLSQQDSVSLWLRLCQKRGAAPGHVVAGKSYTAERAGFPVEPIKCHQGKHVEAFSPHWRQHLRGLREKVQKSSICLWQTTISALTVLRGLEIPKLDGHSSRFSLDIWFCLNIHVTGNSYSLPQFKNSSGVSPKQINIK